MMKVAKFLLPQDVAVALNDALDSDERLAALPASLSETADGCWQLLIYFSEANARVEEAALRRLCTSLFEYSKPEYVIDTVPDTDWVAESLKGLPPVRVGRFLVHGQHERGARRPNDIAIEIEAGQAFGTGHHGTTVGCLATIDRIARSRPIGRALDVGTGSGVLAIAIAKATKARVLASDIDPIAIRVARDNARRNGVASLIAAEAASNLSRWTFQARAPYDLVVANILAGPLVALAPAIARLVAPGGTVVLSGLVPDQHVRVTAAYRGKGLVLGKAFVVDGWLTLIFRRPQAIPAS